jgi:hypothetical protein
MSLFMLSPTKAGMTPVVGGIAAFASTNNTTCIQINTTERQHIILPSTNATCRSVGNCVHFFHRDPNFRIADERVETTTCLIFLRGLASNFAATTDCGKRTCLVDCFRAVYAVIEDSFRSSSADIEAANADVSGNTAGCVPDNEDAGCVADNASGCIVDLAVSVANDIAPGLLMLPSPDEIVEGIVDNDVSESPKFNPISDLAMHLSEGSPIRSPIPLRHCIDVIFGLE